MVEYLQKESRFRSLIKALSWRGMSTTVTIIISYIITRNINHALAIGGIEVISKIALFYAHERLWTGIKIGTDSEQPNRAVSPHK